MSSSPASGNNLGPQLDTAQIDWRDSHPSSQRFADVYYDKESGLAESEFVFLRQNRLRERFAAQGPGHFTVAETGFGTGLNFLLTWDLWNRQVQCPEAILHFVSVERWPLTRADLARSLAAWPTLAELARELLDAYPPAIQGFHRLLLGGGRIRLTLLLGDAETQFARAHFTAHAWFLDGFAPAKNPDLWTSGLFRLIAERSAVGTTFATFSSAGAIRRGLLAQGFDVEKVPGFGRKREMLRGHLQASATGSQVSTTGPEAFPNGPPAFPTGPEALPPACRQAIVIGAGLAGTQIAWNLKQRGWQVRIYDPKGVGQGASGNPQGVLYAKLGVEYSRQTRLQLASLLHAQRLYRQLANLAPRPFWQPCGVLQLAESPAEQTRQQKFLALNRYPAEILRPVSPEEASQLSGASLDRGGLYFAESGAVQPRELCQALLEMADVEVLPQGVAELHFDAEQQEWSLLDHETRVMDRAPVVVLANATAVKGFSQTADLPLKDIRGQVTQCPTPPALRLNTVLCGEGYVAPPLDGYLCTGATFQHGDRDQVVRMDDHRANLAQLARLLPDTASQLQQLPESDLSGRVGFRSASPDYLPLIGPVLRPLSAIPAAGSNLLYSLQADASWSGLYATVGHGSKGLATSALGAELLADLISGQPLCLETDLADALMPGRFALKALRTTSGG